jgi:parvulin-like peptidyl-prolyl isomerase
MRALVLSAAALAGTDGARAAAETVATVNGARISRGQLVNELLVRHGGSVLEDMVRELVVRQAVARAGLRVSADEVDVEIERERRGFAAKGKNLEEMVGAKYQMSMTGYRSIVRRWVLIRKLMLGRENPSDARVMVWFYENRARRYDTPAEYRVSHIFISLADPGTGKDRSQAEIQGRVEAVRNGVLRGRGFAALAKRYSDDPNTRNHGGALGTVNERAARTHLEPNFVEAMVRLKPGQSGMVNTPRGYHFIKMLARKEGRQARYEDFRKIARADYLEVLALLGRELFLRKLMGRARVETTFTPPERGAEGRDIVRDTDEDAGGAGGDDAGGVTKEKP